MQESCIAKNIGLVLAGVHLLGDQGLIGAIYIGSISPGGTTKKGESPSFYYKTPSSAIDR